MELNMKSRITLSNGVTMPILGYSTEHYAYNELTEMEIILDALDAGYRYIETSLEYGSMRALGRAVRKSGIPREELFISSKNRIDELAQRTICDSFNEALDETGLEYLDLFSVNWPYFSSFVRAWVGAGEDEKPHGYPQGLQDFYDMGLVRAIGVCNFDVKHLEQIIEHPRCRIVPMIDQSHFHPEYTCRELRKYCAEHHIAFGGLFLDDHTKKTTKRVIMTDAWDSGEYFETDDERKLANDYQFGKWEEDNKYHRMNRAHAEDGYVQPPFDPLKDPRRERFYYEDSAPVMEIAGKYQKTASQIVTRWSLQHGAVTLVKTMSDIEMRREADVFDFQLTDEEMDKIDSLNVERRIGYHPDFIDF